MAYPRGKNFSPPEKQVEAAPRSVCVQPPAAITSLWARDAILEGKHNVIAGVNGVKRILITDIQGERGVRIDFETERNGPASVFVPWSNVIQAFLA